MKHYAINLMLLLGCGLWLFACRTHHHGLHSSEVLQRENVSEQCAMQSYTSIQQQQTQAAKSETSSWRITFHYDTSKPPQPSTGLPPVQSMSIEGSETMQTSSADLQVQAERVDSTQTTKNAESICEQRVTSESSTEVRAGVDVSNALVGGIVLALLILFIYIIKMKIHA